MEVLERIMSYAGKRRNQVSNPHLTANEAIKLADYLMDILPPKTAPIIFTNIAICDQKPLTKCASNSDGECSHLLCPQVRDNEPRETGRSCSLFGWDDEYE